MQLIELIKYKVKSAAALCVLMDTPTLKGIPEAHRALGDRTLSVHCDMRYSAADMTRVAAVILEALSA